MSDSRKRKSPENQLKKKMEYYQRPEVKERKKEYMKEYNQRPEVKEYRQSPEVRKRKKEYVKEYKQRPGVINRTKEIEKKKILERLGLKSKEDKSQQPKSPDILDAIPIKPIVVAEVEVKVEKTEEAIVGDIVRALEGNSLSASGRLRFFAPQQQVTEVSTQPHQDQVANINIGLD